MTKERRERNEIRTKLNAARICLSFVTRTSQQSNMFDVIGDGTQPNPYDKLFVVAF